MILRFGVELEVFCQDFGANLVGERLVLNSCRIHAEFMLISFFYLEVSQRFAQHFASHWC